MKQNKRIGIFSNWQIKILSFIVAVMTVFIFYYNGQQSRKVVLPLEIILPEGFVPTSNLPQSAELVIKGSEQQIYMFDPEEFSLVADFSKVKEEGVASVLIEVKTSESVNKLNLMDITFYASPAWVKIYFEAK